MKKTLLALAVSGAAVAAPGLVHALEAKISGQINRAIIAHDNGEQDAINHVDNSISGSRIRFIGSEKYRSRNGGVLEYGAKLELQQQSNASSKMQAGQYDDVSDSQSVNIRHQVVYVKGAAGKLSIGQTDGAANGTAETDLSGTSVVSYSDAGSDLLSGINYANTNGTINNNTVGGLTGQFDGLGRHDVIRYDAPAFGPVNLAVSMGNGGSTEVAARYAAEVGEGHKLAAAIGWADAGDYRNNPNGTAATNTDDAKDGLYGTTDDIEQDVSITALSVSFLAAGGFNATLSYSTESNDATDPTYTYAKVGYKHGQHAVSLDYGVRDNDTSADNKPTSTSVGYVYKPASPVDLYASYRVESADLDNVEDVSALILGGRVKF